VFPAEIEEVLLAHPDVAEAAVVGVPDSRWGEVGRAYLVAREGTYPTGDEMIEFCRGRLARYKTPKQVVFLPVLPKSSAGKILKRELVHV
jgi:fatty-acyl-CoA synthase